MRVSFPGLVTLLFAASILAQQQASEPGDLQRVLLVDANQTFQMRDNVASSKSSWQVVISKQFYTFSGPRAASGTGIRTPHPAPDKSAPRGHVGAYDRFTTASLGLRPRHGGLATSLAGGVGWLLGACS